MKRYTFLAAVVVALALAGSAFAAGDQIIGSRLPNTLKQDYTFTGTVTMSGNHTHTGALAVTGATTLNGNVTLGDAAGDAILVTGTPTITPLLTLTNDLVVNGSDVTIGGTGVKLTGDGDGAITLLGLGDGADEDLTINLDDTANSVVLSSSTSADTIVGLASYSLGAAGVKITGDGDGAITLLGLGNGSDEDLTINLDDTANTVSISSTTDVATISTGTIDVKVAELITTPPSAQTIAEGDTITADACGGLKQITAASGVTTGTTHTFTAPAAGNAGCCMFVVNVGAQTITLDANGNFFSKSAGNVAVTANDALTVCSNGTAWYQITDLEAN